MHAIRMATTLRSMTFWKKLTQPPRVERKALPPAQARQDPDDIFTSLGVGLSTWIVGESLGGSTPEIVALIAYPHLVRAAAVYGAETGANQPPARSGNPSPETTPPVQ